MPPEQAPQAVPAPIVSRCPVQGCEGAVKIRDFCKRHYSSFQRGRIDLQGSPIPRRCKQCGREFQGHGNRALCSKCLPRVPGEAAHAVKLTAWWNQTGKARYGSKNALGDAVGVNHTTVNLWFRGYRFPMKDEVCAKLYEITQLDCFGPDPTKARAKYKASIPREVKAANHADYAAHKVERRAANRKHWHGVHKQVQHEQRRVTDAELDELRYIPGKKLTGKEFTRKNVCRVGGEDAPRDCGPHIESEHPMSVGEYKLKWGFPPHSNGTRSEETQEKHRETLEDSGHQPPARGQELAADARRIYPKCSLYKSHRFFKDLCRCGYTRQHKRGTPVCAEGRFHMRQPIRLDGKEKESFYQSSDASVAIDAKIATLRLAGKTQKQIAKDKDVELHIMSVNRRLKCLGFPRSPYFLHGEPVSQGAIKADHADLAEFRQKSSAGSKGGRPKQLRPADEVKMLERYHALRSNLLALRKWIKDARPATISLVWEWLCRQFRRGHLRALQFSPEFLAWVEKNCNDRSFRRGADELRLGEWTPRDLTCRFLDLEFHVSEGFADDFTSRNGKLLQNTAALAAS